MAKSLGKLGQRLKHELQVHRRALRDPRTPTAAKVLLALAVGYLVLPFDFIPDWIPLLGQLDDVVVLALLVVPTRWLIPDEVLDENHQREPIDV
jgi:uncharacterized membrane protein YkvA (DUF1232 family)